VSLFTPVGHVWSVFHHKVQWSNFLVLLAGTVSSSEFGSRD
jgi:hypothetical protein